MPHPKHAVNHRLVEHIDEQCVPPHGTQRAQNNGRLSPFGLSELGQKYPAPEQEHPRKDREVIRRCELRQIRETQPEPVRLVQPRRHRTEPPILEAQIPFGQLVRQRKQRRRRRQARARGQALVLVRSTGILPPLSQRFTVTLF